MPENEVWEVAPACNTGGHVGITDDALGIEPNRDSDQEASNLVEVVGYGVDDLHLAFDYTAQKTLHLMLALPHMATAYGRKLGAPGNFGVWEHRLGHYALFSERTNRLTVQLKLGVGGALTRPHLVAEAVRRFEVAQAVRGLETFSEGFVRRVDVAVDVRCRPHVGRAIIDAMAGVRLSGGRRVEVMGDPRSTVYFRPQRGKGVLARTYCRNLKTGKGEPYGLIRFEAQHRFDYGAAKVADVARPEIQRLLWVQRFGSAEVGSTVRRVDREGQTMTLADLVEAGELTYAQMERLGTFLDLERLGRARAIYPPSTYAQRRREARALGLAKTDLGEGALDVDLGELIAPARAAWGD